jgi:hypothetical protein
VNRPSWWGEHADAFQAMAVGFFTSAIVWLGYITF